MNPLRKTITLLGDMYFVIGGSPTPTPNATKNRSQPGQGSTNSGESRESHNLGDTRSVQSASEEMKLLVLSFLLAVFADAASATSSVRKRTISVGDEQTVAGGEHPMSIEELDDASREKVEAALIRLSEHGTKNLVRHISSSLHDLSSSGEEATSDAAERKLRDQTCMDQTDALYDTIGADVSALFASGQPCGPSFEFMPMKATIDHSVAKGCDGPLVTAYEAACAAANGTAIRVGNLEADCDVDGILPWPVAVTFIGTELHVCLSDECGNATEISGMTLDEVTDMVDIMGSGITSGLGLPNVAMACGVTSVENIQVPATNAAATDAVTTDVVTTDAVMTANSTGTSTTNTTAVAMNVTN